jgi:hypothetical protein
MKSANISEKDSDKCRMNNINSKKRIILLYTIFTIYIVINAVAIYYHEPWRDEAQTFLLDRDLSIKELVDMMASEGHSCLWHLLSYPFIKMGVGIYIQNIFSLVLCSVAAWLVLFRAPFHIGLRILIVFSSILTYEYPVIARCYALVPLILFLAADMYPSREKHPYQYSLLLALLVQTHLYMLMMAFLMSLFFLVEQFKKGMKENHLLKNLLPLLLPFLSALFLIYEVTPLYQTNSPVTAVQVVMAFYQMMKSVTGDNLFLIARLLCFILVISLLAPLFLKIDKRDKHIFTIMSLSIIFQAYFAAAIYPTNMQRIILIFCILTWGIWILYEPSKSINLSQNHENAIQLNIWTLFRRFLLMELSVFCMFLLVESGNDIRKDLIQPYSNAKNAAAYMNSNCDSDSIVFADYEPAASSLLPYLTDVKTMIDGSNGRTFSFVQWNQPHDLYLSGGEELYDSIVKLIKNGNYNSSVYLVSCNILTKQFMNSKTDFVKVYESEEPAIVLDENYTIYKYEG